MTAKENNHQVYYEVSNNPDLILSIIDRSFGYAQADCETMYGLKHLAESIDDCERINSMARSEAINKMYNTLDTPNKGKVKTRSKVMRIIDFSAR